MRFDYHGQVPEPGIDNSIVNVTRANERYEICFRALHILQVVRL